MAEAEWKGLNQEQERAWLKAAHSRFRRAVAEKSLTERRSRLRLLVRMVELGKQAIREDAAKPVNRKEYECTLWDRFYESEYLELQAE